MASAVRHAHLLFSAAGERYAKIAPEEKTKEAFRMFDHDGLGKVRYCFLAKREVNAVGVELWQ